MKSFIDSYKYYILCAFTVAEIGIYIAFLAIQCTRDYDPVMLKYSGILLCLLMAIVLCPVRGREGIALACAFVVTAISDLFIFVIDDYYDVGLCTFILAQTCYLVRIYMALGKKPYISIAVRLGLSGIVMLVLALTGNLDSLTALVAIYFPMLVCNAVESVFLFKISKIYILFFVGLILFIGCDVCVGLNNFSMLGIELSKGAQDFVGIGMWAFYLPSQVLIALSAREVHL